MSAADAVPSPGRAADESGSGVDSAEVRFAAFRKRQIAVLERLAGGAPLHVTFEAVIQMIQEQSPGTLASILTLDTDGLHLRHGAAPDLPEAYCRAIDGAEIGPCVGSCGTAAYLGRRVIVSDIASDPLWADFRELALGHGLRSCWSEPILDSVGAVQGSFAMYHRTVSHPGDEELQIIRVAAHLAGIAIERERAELARVATERKLLEAQKLESLGVLAGGVAHDFNNLLTGILGNAGLARMKAGDDAPVNDMLLGIEQAALRAADLCKQMLAYAGKGRFVVESLDMSALVEDLRGLLQLSISKRSVLRLKLATGLPCIQGDATQLRQILMNLVINASESIGDAGGSIDVSTGLMTADRAYLAATRYSPDVPEGDFVFVQVSDTGAGMSAETRARLFEPFFSTKFTGRGLGLAAVLGIVRGHDGALKVDSEPGQGTTFRLLLPCREAPASTPGTPPESPTVALARGGAVLVVDDEESVRSVASRILEAHGFTVLTASDGIEAVALFRARRSPIHLVLLDLTMPHLSGEETFRELRRQQPDLRILLISGFSEQESVSGFTAPGLAGFLQKPFTPTALVNKVRSVLA